MRPGLLIARVDLPVYWASTRRVAEQLLAAVEACPDPPRVLLVDWSNQPNPGTSLLATGADLNQQLHQRNVALWIADGRPSGGTSSPSTDAIRRFPSLTGAIDRFRSPGNGSSPPECGC